ncbi:MAG: transposase [Bellilinea sp.]
MLLYTARRAPTGDIPTHEQFGKPVAGSIPTIVRGFKSAATKRINIFRNTPGVPVWQRNYYEHIIRDEKSYLEIAQYIFDNPAHWETDSENT